MTLWPKGSSLTTHLKLNTARRNFTPPLFKWFIVYIVVYLMFFLSLSFSRSHLSQFSPEEPHQVGAGRRVLLSEHYMQLHPKDTMDLHVSSSEPYHRVVAAGRVHQHHRGLQQQGEGLWWWFHGPAGPPAAGRRVLRGHSWRLSRKQQRSRLCPESEWWVYLALYVCVCVCVYFCYHLAFYQ